MTNRETGWSQVLGRGSTWVVMTLTAAVFLAWTGPGIEEAAFAAVAAVVVVVVRHRLAGAELPAVDAAGVGRFVVYFATVSVRGGIDVARRALSPSMPLDPGFVDIELRIDPQSPAAVVFGATISLVPGTLCVEIGEGETALVHLVDRRAGFERELERLEARVAGIFGDKLEVPTTNDGEEQ